jgi:hypothetical protein
VAAAAALQMLHQNASTMNLLAGALASQRRWFKQHTMALRENVIIAQRQRCDSASAVHPLPQSCASFESRLMLNALLR